MPAHKAPEDNSLSASRSGSLIYRHVLIYRFVVNLLFLGRYRQRFERVIALLDPVQDRCIVELCFGDIHIAEWCKKNKVWYQGIDVNPHFVKWAGDRGYNVTIADIRDCPPLSESDVVIIMGSLYHFHDILAQLIDWAMGFSRRLIISEPIVNWSSRGDIWGRIARNSANAGRGQEEFRYDEETLRKALEEVSTGRYSFDFAVHGKEAIVELRRLENAS